MKNYINNLETRHIELHFAKSEYDALSDALKADLKGAYLWSRSAHAWVSRSTTNHYRALQIAKKLGFEGEEVTGERLSYAEQIERKAERAEARVERMEEHAENAEKRAETLQADFNKYRQDWSWLTQPIISGHAGSQRFARQRDAVMNRYNKGFEEYKKSEYFRERAATAQQTANKAQLKDPIYLDNRIRECKKNIRAIKKNIVANEDTLYRIEQGETLRNYHGDIVTAEAVQARLKEIIESLEWEMDKQGYLENAMSALGRKIYTPEEIKVGYIVNMIRHGKCEIVGAGPVNVQIKILTGGAAGMVLTESYIEINSIEAVKAPETIVNPFKADDILCLHRPADDSIYRAFQVIKATDKSIMIQEITLTNHLPNPGAFKPGSKPERKGIVKSKYSEYVGAYYGDWQLHKYSA